MQFRKSEEAPNGQFCRWKMNDTLGEKKTNDAVVHTGTHRLTFVNTLIGFVYLCSAFTDYDSFCVSLDGYLDMHLIVFSI